MILRNKALKAAISVFVCVLIANYFKLKYPFFVVLPAIMPISFSIQETMKAGVNRMLGTVIGALVGLALVLILPSNPTLAAIGIIIIIYLCNFIKWGSSASIAGLVFISIMLGIKGDTPWLYSLDRIFNTFIGIVATLVINNLLFHVDLVKVAEKKASAINCIIVSYIKSVLCKNLNPRLPELDEKLKDIEEHMEISSHEFIFQKVSKEKLQNMKEKVKLQTKILQHIKIIYEFSADYKISEENNKKAIALFNCSCSKSDSLTDKDIVFNYHLESILTLITELNKY